MTEESCKYRCTVCNQEYYVDPQKNQAECKYCQSDKKSPSISSWNRCTVCHHTEKLVPIFCKDCKEDITWEAQYAGWGMTQHYTGCAYNKCSECGISIYGENALKSSLVLTSKEGEIPKVRTCRVCLKDVKLIELLEKMLKK